MPAARSTRSKGSKAIAKRPATLLGEKAGSQEEDKENSQLDGEGVDKKRRTVEVP